MSVFLCIDVGSQSVRASLINTDGQFLGKSQIALPAFESLNPGWAEFPAAGFWNILQRAVNVCLEQAPEAAQSILALGITCQRATVINLDSNGNALRPAILWSDRRRTKNVPPVGGLTGLGMDLLGVGNTVRNFQAEAETNWLTAHQPEIWEITNKFVFLSGYLNYRLTGQFVDSIASQVGYIPFDYKKQRWARARKWHWRALPGVRRQHLPDLVPPGEILGTLTTGAGQALGLPPGLPVVACATDKACEVLGSGCIASSQACLSFGTAATVNVTQKKYREAERFVPPFPAALPNHYLSELQIYRGFWLVSWFKNEFAQMESSLAREQDIQTETLFDKFLAETPPGALGLTALPYWSPGVRLPGPEARGALIGFNDSHTRAHVYRALLEGLLYSLREGLERITACTGTPVSLIRVAGGGSQSDQILQMTADVFNLPVERNRVYEASSLGVAICCAVATKQFQTFQSAVSRMTGTGKEFQPRPVTAKLYQQLYQEVYAKMYSRLKPLYKTLMGINQD